LVSSGLAAVLAGKAPRLAAALGAGGAVLACAAGLIPAIAMLAGSPAPSPIRLPWDVPMGSFAIGLDSLSAWFVAITLLVSGLGAVYGAKYLLTGHTRVAMGVHWFFYNLLVAGMLVVLLARNGVLFLVAWEIMSLASYFLVVTDDQDKAVRRAGWIYLVATHIGTAFLLAMFVLLGNGNGSLDFDAIIPPVGGAATAIFLLAAIGFGTKAGFMPLHVWLPEAHPAAPSHVSAVMSGVMIKTGIYGLIRVVMFLGPVQPWWGWTLIGVGAASGVLGVLFALAQHNLKRLLAYSSVENIGIITMGLGIGLLGISHNNPAVAALGMAGALLHVLNHSLFKSLLFLGAGAVAHATGSLQIDRLGGLIKRMPRTAACFVIGAAAICGLPPLNGFVSEWLIYVSAYRGINGFGESGLVGGGLVIGALALIGGLAAACFAKAFGIVFLGEPRTAEARDGHEVDALMRWPMIVLAAACVAVGLLGPLVLRAVEPAVAAIMQAGGMQSVQSAGDVGPVWMITLAAAILLGLIVVLALVRRRLLAGRSVRSAGTWDCGYVAPDARMQYTASSFVQPITELGQSALRTESQAHRPAGLFPAPADFHSRTPDVFLDRGFTPIFRGLAGLFARMHWLQQGRLQLYVLYIALALLILLAWKLS
jgi:formate hydrogenlyase subunit 3/multisubunit Na+/H+ antiporter MnhD subunit